MENKELFKSKSIKATQPRIIIIELFKEINEPLSADKILEICKERKLFIDLSTIYRTIDLFYEKNIIDRIDLGDGKYRYKMKVHDHKHVLECIQCHEKTEIECPMYSVGENIKDKTGFTVVSHELKIKAICEKCKKED
ncbi:Fur family transcriptional regulator [Clostridium cellulovorans]|uniref:Ferric uptake regulator, Fur family n=1 Tax=Clostridium cellulovorans (strain ATCC 35296 / DSM 3052 / OCM 3 / 743B) TaxID=573061 RepID=D9SSV2_CLOC7|nr:Fur family transcriptional regulator [Clostridium cellulovorans]ADL52614.1 ferric uptake regulator, Fur family [Clostridium cellulovorans 743B]